MIQLNTKILMITSAVIMGGAGIILSFLPDETAAWMEWGSDSTIALQLLGALLFGFAMINWMAKGNLIGGIYSRPIAIGNFTHFFIGALALIRSATGGSHSSILLIATVAYSMLGILFGYVLFTHPLGTNE